MGRPVTHPALKLLFTFRQKSIGLIILCSCSDEQGKGVRMVMNLEGKVKKKTTSEANDTWRDFLVGQ